MTPVADLPYEFRERLEIMERNSLNNIKTLIMRSIEVINLLDILNFNGDPQIFVKVWKRLRKEHRIQFA